MLAAAGANAGTTKRILDAGADVSRATRSGWTALMFAAKAGAEDVAIQLLTAGADPRAENRKGEAALKIAKRAKNSRGVSNHVIALALRGELDDFLTRRAAEKARWDFAELMFKHTFPAVIGAVVLYLMYRLLS